MSDNKAILEAPLARIPERIASAIAAQGITREAFDALVREHQRRIYRILFLQLRDVDAAETLTQECFLRAYAKRDAFRGEASAATWLIRIALNLARDHVRSRRLAFWRHLGRARLGSQPIPLEGVVVDPEPPPERRLIARERVAAMWARVNQLSDRQRTCFLLRFLEEMPIEKIAEVLELKVGTVKAHLARAVAALRLHLQKQEGPCEDI